MSDIGVRPVGVRVVGRISVLKCGTAGLRDVGHWLHATRNCVCALWGSCSRQVTCRHTEISNSTSLGEKWLQAKDADLDGI